MSQTVFEQIVCSSPYEDRGKRGEREKGDPFER